MASITQAESRLFSRPNPIDGLHEDLPIPDEFIEVLPWVRMEGHEVHVVRVTSGSFGSATWIAPGAAAPDSSSVPTTPATAFELRRVEVDLLLDSFSEAIYSSPTDVDIAQVELDAKLRNCRYAIGRALVIGAGGASNEPQGIRGQTIAAQTVGASDEAPNGGPLLLTDVDRLLALIRANNGRADVLVMNLAVRQKWEKAHYDKGLAPRVVRNAETGLDDFYHGRVRVVVSEHLPSNETKGLGTNLSSMFAVVLGYGKGLAGGWKPGAGGEYFDIERELVAGADQHRYRVSAQVTFPLFSRRALARLNGIS
ncbi:MAG: hypothetical protein AAB434_06185 [Planctomycetota bacterium]